MRPQLGPAIASLLAYSTAGPSCWTYGVGVTASMCCNDTPTSNATEPFDGVRPSS
jgi:hypothetical protein